MSRFTFCLPFAALLGCSSLHGLRVETLGVSAQRPSQVAAYLSITDDGKPLRGLTSEDFAVYEDGQALTRAQTQQVLLEREIAAAHHTLLLVDNSLATQKDVRKELASAIAMFVAGVRPIQAVSVYAFDGGNDIRHVADFPKAENAGSPDVRRLAELVPADTSRNLNGAVAKAAVKLEALLAEQRQPLKIGTLVVFSGGPDLAGRSDASAPRDALQNRQFQVLSIGIGEPSSEVEAIGDEYIDAHSADTLSLAFEDAAHRVQDGYGKFYLFAYCSPARAGTRELRIEVEVRATDGQSRQGESYAEFEAKGFGPGCNPRAVPRFELRPASRNP